MTVLYNCHSEVSRSLTKSVIQENLPVQNKRKYVLLVDLLFTKHVLEYLGFQVDQKVQFNPNSAEFPESQKLGGGSICPPPL